MTPTATRQNVLEAALACFLENGYEQTTIAQIRDASRVSNGALFHHFPSKEAIADTLYVQAIASFQQGLWELLAGKPRSLRAGVHGTISHQLSWVEQHPELARFVYMRGHLDWESQAFPELAALNQDLGAAFREWMAPLVQSGAIRPTSLLVITALVNGPAHAIARRWLAGHLDGSPLAFADELADAACAALRGTRVPQSHKRPAVQRARVALELISDAGDLLAQSQVVTDLIPVETAGAA
jgi:AcrR family transcriptional regulator